MTDDIRDSLDENLGDLRRFAGSLTSNTAEAEDLVQDVAERALRRKALFTPGTNLRAWLFTIMKNIHIDKCRARARRGHTVPVEDYSAQLTEAPRQMDSLVLNNLQTALDKLPRADRELVVLAGVRGHGYQALANRFGVAVGTIKSRLSRTRARLRKDIGELPEAA